MPSQRSSRTSRSRALEARETPAEYEYGGPNYSTTEPPFEAGQLRSKLVQFLDSEFPLDSGRKIGNYRWAVYGFYDFDGEPIYVGQTNEMLRTRVRRHLTNQRTDAVAMRVLDPFEVCSIEVWPLPQFQETDKKDPNAKRYLNELEFAVYQRLLSQSAFQAVLNEKEPISAGIEIVIPDSFRELVVSQQVATIRDHPDLRIARRAATLAALARIISERSVKVGLRRVLHVQAKRLEWLARKRLEARPVAPDERDEPDTPETDELGQGAEPT